MFFVMLGSFSENLIEILFFYDFFFNFLTIELLFKLKKKVQFKGQYR